MSLSCLAKVKRTNGSRPSAPPDVVYAHYTGDRSGSMQNQFKASANGVYEWVKEMSSGVINNGQEGYISVTFFDTQVEKRLDNVKMDEVEISMKQAYEWSQPRNSTKMYDTAIEAVNMLRRRIKEHKKRCPNLNIHGVFQLFSDGYDNQSRATSDHLQSAIEGARKDGISCIYLGIGQDAVEVGQKYGFDARTSLSADVGDEYAEMAFRGCSLNALRSASSGRSEGFEACLRQSSAPSQQVYSAGETKTPQRINLRQPAQLHPLAQSHRNSMLRATALPFVPNISQY